MQTAAGGPAWIANATVAGWGGWGGGGGREERSIVRLRESENDSRESPARGSQVTIAEPFDNAADGVNRIDALLKKRMRARLKSRLVGDKRRAERSVRGSPDGGSGEGRGERDEGGLRVPRVSYLWKGTDAATLAKRYTLPICPLHIEW